MLLSSVLDARVDLSGLGSTSRRPLPQSNFSSLLAQLLLLWPCTKLLQGARITVKPLQWTSLRGRRLQSLRPRRSFRGARWPCHSRVRATPQLTPLSGSTPIFFKYILSSFSRWQQCFTLCASGWGSIALSHKFYPPFRHETNAEQARESCTSI